ncbi:hypothetical protein GGI42DRAFT_317144, partial [Trichoderma sp. SZMC 28013]
MPGPSKFRSLRLSAASSLFSSLTDLEFFLLLLSSVSCMCSEASDITACLPDGTSRVKIWAALNLVFGFVLVISFV